MTQPSATSTPQLRRDKRAVWAAWAGLSAATVLAWLLTPDESRSATTVGNELVAAIVVLALIKCRLIIGYFMEVRHAPRWLKLATDAWLVVLWLALLAIYLI